MNNQLTIAFTGHRPNKLGNEYDGIGAISDAIRKDIQYMIDQYDVQNVELKFITGMALGVDMIAAEMATLNNIPFIAAIPCANQEMMWPPVSRERYHKIISHHLCKVYYVSMKPYDSQCMQLRNIWMVDNSARLRAYWDGTSGGTKNCVTYAKSISRPIDTINPFSLIERV